MTEQLSNKAPEIVLSTPEERRNFIRQRFPCLADCDNCGLCVVFHGLDPEEAYRDYIMGRRTFLEVSADYRK